MELFHILVVASLLPLPFAVPSCVGSLSPGVKIRFVQLLKTDPLCTTLAAFYVSA